ncbi:thermitase [Melghirimyces profundicolus]|uniref:Thermitase n=1 Tax=Melghirimyces profundicolus TaxID=1242148 RepID=A0A2T6BS51_9BACL|nr:S8 family peptidase [Melghirimyces profundicolus]PTX58869.1 thermitase [Melghirimyces profundicolus]
MIKIKRSVVLSAAFLLVAALILPAAHAEWDRPPAAGEIIVKYKDNTSAGILSKIHEQVETRLLERNDRLNLDVVKPDGQSFEEVLEAYRENPHVEYAEPNITFHTFETPDDPQFSRQWGLKKVDAPSAWDITRGDSGVKVAIVDTGVDHTHPDLSGKVIEGKDYVENDGDPMDENGHGTHVAGTVAAFTGNGTGIAGMAPEVSLYAVRVLNEEGTGSLDDVASGIVEAADAGAEVINLSLGATKGSQTLQDAVEYAHSMGALVVAAAGNEGVSTPSYPAFYGETLSVAATDSEDRKADFTNYGKWVEVAAPGVDILSTVPGGGIQTMSGTSMATPHVAGLAGLLASRGRNASQIRTAIEETAEDISGTGVYWSKGRINAREALQY